MVFRQLVSFGKAEIRINIHTIEGLEIRMNTHTVNNQNWTQTGALLKLIAHPQRLQVLSMLLEAEYNLQEMSQETGIPATVLSVHLSKLRSSGIVDYTRFHRVMQYRIISDEVKELLQTINRLNWAEITRH